MNLREEVRAYCDATDTGIATLVRAADLPASLAKSLRLGRDILPIHAKRLRETMDEHEDGIRLRRAQHRYDFEVIDSEDGSRRLLVALLRSGLPRGGLEGLSYDRFHALVAEHRVAA